MSGTQETALTLARELSGAGEAEEALLELLCQAAEQQWEKWLRPGMTTEDCGKAFPCAVAFTAAADLAAARGGEGVSGFTAGSVSVRIRGAAESCALAESLRRTAERLMAPFAGPDDLCFRGVRGCQTGCGRSWSDMDRMSPWTRRTESGPCGHFYSR